MRQQPRTVARRLVRQRNSAAALGAPVSSPGVLVTQLRSVAADATSLSSVLQGHRPPPWIEYQLQRASDGLRSVALYVAHRPKRSNPHGHMAQQHLVQLREDAEYIAASLAGGTVVPEWADYKIYGAHVDVDGAYRELVRSEQTQNPGVVFCDPEAAYRAELYNQEIIQGLRRGSLTFAPGVHHVSDCMSEWPAIEERVRHELDPRSRNPSDRVDFPAPGLTPSKVEHWIDQGTPVERFAGKAREWADRIAAGKPVVLDEETVAAMISAGASVNEFEGQARAYAVAALEQIRAA